MFELLAPIIGLATACSAIGLSIRFIARPRKALASGVTIPKLLAPSPTTFADTDFERRLERHGIIILGFGPIHTLLDDHHLLYEEPGRMIKLSELLVRNQSAHADRCFALPYGDCPFCQKFSFYRVKQIVRFHDELVLRSGFGCCARCGKLGVSPDDHMPSRFVGVKNILDWLDEQDRGGGETDKAERLRQLRDEHEQLRTKLATTELEILRLDHELNPRTELDAYRDRHLLPDPGVPVDRTPKTTS